MSFLQELVKNRKSLRHTETVVTCADGTRYIEKQSGSNNIRIVSQKSTFGFVIDANPDDVPALVIPNLYLGSQDCTAPDVLAKYDINTVLSVGIEAPVKLANVEYHFCECLDLPETELRESIEYCSGIINKCLGEKANILVHCNAGVSRSASVIIGFLILEEGKSYEEAYGLVKRARSYIRPNDGFVGQLKILK